MSYLKSAAAAAVLTVLFMAQAFGAAGSLHFDNSVSASFNQFGPNGFELATKFYYNQPLSDSDDVLWKSTKIQFGIMNSWTPSDDQLGLFVNWEPIAVFDISLKGAFICSYNVIGYGNYLVNFPINNLSDYNPYNVKSNSYATNMTGLWFSAKPNLKIAVGPIVAMSGLLINYISMFRITNYYLEAHSFVVHAPSDWDFTSDSYLMYNFSDISLMAGINFNALFVPSVSYSSYRPALVALFAPKIAGLNSFYAAGFAGWNLTLNELYIAVSTGIGMKL